MQVSSLPSFFSLSLFQAAWTVISVPSGPFANSSAQLLPGGSRAGDLHSLVLPYFSLKAKASLKAMS